MSLCFKTQGRSSGGQTLAYWNTLLFWAKCRRCFWVATCTFWKSFGFKALCVHVREDMGMTALSPALHIKIPGGSKMIWFYQIWEAINKSWIEINHHPANAGCWTLREGETRETAAWKKKIKTVPFWAFWLGSYSKTTSSLCWNQLPCWGQVCSALLSAPCGSRLAPTLTLLFFSLSFFSISRTHTYTGVHL